LFFFFIYKLKKLNKKYAAYFQNIEKKLFSMMVTALMMALMMNNWSLLDLFGFQASYTFLAS